MTNAEAYERELAMWHDLFAAATPEAQKTAGGLIKKAAYLHALCSELEEVINTSGAIKVHPDHPELQRQVPAVKEYARLSEAYANIVNKLNQLRVRNAQDDGEDDLDEYDDD